MSQRKWGEEVFFPLAGDTVSSSQPERGEEGPRSSSSGLRPHVSRWWLLRMWLPRDGAAGFCPWGQPACAHLPASLTPPGRDFSELLAKTCPEDSKGCPVLGSPVQER